MRVRKVVELLILVCAFQSSRAYGQVVATWTDSSGNWSNAANWSTNPTVPNNSGGTTYGVVINGTGSDTITYDASGTVLDSLALGAGEIFQNNGSSQTLTVGSLTNSGTINWGNSSTLLAGSLANSRFATVNLTGLSSLVANGINSDGIININNSVLTVNGDFSSVLGGLQFQNGSVGTIAGSYGGGYSFVRLSVENSVVTIGGDARPSDTAIANGSVLRVQGSFINGPQDLGTFTLSGGSSAVIGRNFSNNLSGTTTIDDSFLSVGGNYSNVGFNLTAVENGGSLLVLGSIGNFEGSFTLSGGSSAVIGGGFQNGNGAEVSIDHSSLNVGAFMNSGGSVILSPMASLTAGSYSQGAGLTDVSGTLRTNSFSQTGGTTTIETGGTVTATTFTVTGGTVTVNGILDPTAVEFGSGAALQGNGTIIGNVAMGGTLTPGAPGAPGTLTIDGNYEQLSTGMLQEIMGSQSQSFLNVTGDVALDAGSFLDIILLNGYNPLGQTFDIMDYGSLVGQFSNGSIFSEDGYVWDITYGQHGMEVTAVGTPEPSSFLLLGLGSLVLGAFAKRKKVAQ